MLYPLLQKRILSSIRVAFENFILRPSHCNDSVKYDVWLNRYLELTESDKLNIVKKVERAQTASIIYAMAQKDREVFINQLGCFYIKPTTSAFYNELDRLIAGREKGEYDYEEIKKSALEQSRAVFYRIANIKKHGKVRSIKV